VAGGVALAGVVTVVTSSPADAQTQSASCSQVAAENVHCFLGLVADGNGAGISVSGVRADISDFSPDVPDVGGASSAWVALENTSSSLEIDQIGWAKLYCGSAPCPDGFVSNAPTYFYEWWGSYEGSPLTLQMPQALFAIPSSEFTASNGFGTDVTHLYEVIPNNVGWGFYIDGHEFASVPNAAGPGGSYSPLDPNAAAYLAEMFTPQDYAPGATNYHEVFDNTEHLYGVNNWYPDALSGAGNAVNTDLPNGNETSTGTASFQMWDSRSTICSL
jgi:hypothetical protein